MTLRENAQFIDELRQHYHRLDGLLVVYAPALPAAATWELTEPVIALRRLLFGEVGNPNLKAAAAASPAKLEVVR